MGFYFYGVQLVTFRQPFGVGVLIAMSNINIFGSRRQYRFIQLIPVTVIRKDKSPVHSGASPGTTQLHPTATDSLPRRRESVDPRGRQGRRGCHNHRSLNGLFGHIGSNSSSGKSMSLRIKGVIYVCHGAVQKNVPDALVKMMENGLGFTQGISNNDGIEALRSILPPPVIDAGIDFSGWGKLVYRESKGRFGDKMVAFDRLKRCA